MEEVGHHVDLQRNILWLGQTAPGGWFKHRLDGLARNEGGRRSEGTTMAALAKPVSMVSEETANMEDLDGDLAATAPQYEKLMTAMAQRFPEILETVVTEIVDKVTFQLDCTMLWAQVISSEAEITGDDTAPKILELERHICAQYQDLFQEPTCLPPTRMDGGFRIRMIPGIESPHKSPSRLTPHG
jgi:hypothetical protein